MSAKSFLSAIANAKRQAIAAHNRAIQENERQERTRKRQSLKDSLGVDMAWVLDTPEVKAAMYLGACEAAQYITSVPAVYFKGITEAVLKYYQQLPQPEGRTVVEQIQHLTGLAADQAALIASDQTSKIHTAVNKARNESIGIKKYIWRTAKDIRVVGTPGGTYPVGTAAHGNHYEREGKVFYWDGPPSDGHPGWAIGCRCYAEPVIDLKELNLI